MTYQLHISTPSKEWEPLKNECFEGLVLAIGRAKILISGTQCTKIAVTEALGRAFRLGPHIIKFISGLEKPYYIHPDYKSDILIALGNVPLTFADIGIKFDKVTVDKCPDCHGVGFYVPFIGPKEPCRTCTSNV